MKKLFYIILFSITMIGNAQESNNLNNNEVNFELGEGLNFNFEDNQYQFKISGFIQPSYTYLKTEELDAEHEFNSRRSYFSLSGKALKEKVSFLIQTDFSDSDILLDAWLAYHPTENINITVGQKRVDYNNVEMRFNEDKFQFTRRSELSRALSNTGREFGLFVDAQYNLGGFGIEPFAGVSSGDGRNSFGADSRDVDSGGIKYGGRLNLYPFGFFTKGNDNTTADLMHEEEFKLVIGAAGSYNDGASESVGEGHNIFEIFDENGDVQLPDYRQLYVDMLIKYKGFSFLTEYANATATGLEETFINAAGTVALQPQQISSYLALGDAINVQTGYATKSGYAIDFRYSSISPEFEALSNSVLQDTTVYILGLTKYIKGHDLKIQTAFSSIDMNGVSTFQADLVFQIVF
jgi:hypothetical protein